MRDFDMTNSLPVLSSFVSDLEQRGIKVVIVDMPVIEGLYAPFHPHGASDYDAYRAALLTVGAPVVTIDGSRWSPRVDFVDTIHLNRAGATRFSRNLATRLAQR